MPHCGIQHALLNIVQFVLQHFVQFLRLQRMKHHNFVQAIHDSGENLRLATSATVLPTLSCNPVVTLSFGWTNPIPSCGKSSLSGHNTVRTSATPMPSETPAKR